MTIPSFEYFQEVFTKYGLEALGRYYALAPAVVVSTADPEALGRVQVVIPEIQEVAGDQWLPMLQSGGANHGIFNPPNVKDVVHAVFRAGDPRRPIGVLPGIYGSENIVVPEELRPTASSPPYKRGWVTRRGLSLILDETPESERVELRWRTTPGPDDVQVTPARSTTTAAVLMDRTGLSLADAHGNTFVMNEAGIVLKDRHGNEIRMGAGGITLVSRGVSIGDGATEPIVLGSEFVREFQSHTHGTVMGPSTPPQVPMSPAVLSSQHRVK